MEFDWRLTSSALRSVFPFERFIMLCYEAIMVIFQHLVNLWVNIGTQWIHKEVPTTHSHSRTLTALVLFLTMAHTITFNQNILILSKSTKFIIVSNSSSVTCTPSLLIRKWPYLVSKHVRKTSGVTLLCLSHRKRKQSYQVLATATFQPHWLKSSQYF